MKKQINGERLRAEITKRGMSLQQASFEIGHGANYLSVACVSNRLEEHAMISLGAKFNIKASDILETPETKPETSNLEDIIYRAVSRALVEAKWGAKND